MSEAKSPGLVRRRRAAAEDVCWKLTIMMNLEDPGRLSPRMLREWIDEDFTRWADLAVETGILQP